MTALHPTVLIGYGAYGLEVLQKLLSAAAARGSLAWDEAGAPGTSRPSERKLEVLALFWVPDVLGLEQDARKHSQASDSFEMMLDLYEQIETVEGGEDLAQRLASRVETAKRRLFKQNRMQASQSHVSLGLDVIVLARPSHETVVGKLRELMDPVMKRLAEDPGLTAPRAGQDLLNFIQVLDFEDFWNPAPDSQAVRSALGRALADAEAASAGGRPAFGRLYLMDGRTERGNQDERVRINQAVLFLELLLFEGKRGSAEFRFLYQRGDPGASALCVAGVRAIEFSGARLRRLAAASFGRGWLEYLAGAGPSEASCADIEAELAPFGRDRFDETVNTGQFDGMRKQAAKEIEKELLALDMRDKDWPRLVEKRSEELVADWQQRLAAGAVNQLTDEWNTKIGGLRERLVAAVSRCLMQQQTPTTLGGVLSALTSWQAALAPEPDREAESAPDEKLPAEAVGLADAHRAFLKAQQELVDPLQLRRWWPLFAVAAAAAFLPIALGGLQALIPSLGPRWAIDGGVAIFLIAFFWVVGAKLFHPPIEKSINRSLDFHRHPERGRLADALRAVVASERVEGDLRRAAREAKWSLQRRILGEVQAILSVLRARLQTRRDEIGWLGQQLRDYLSLHGVDAGKAEPRFLPNRRPGDVNRSIENDHDLQAVAYQLSRDGGRFREVQRKLAVFEGWNEPFHRFFLDPHRLLDLLSESFTIPDWQEDGDVAQRRETEIVSAIGALEKFPISFYWHRTDGLPESVALCSAPSHWLRLGDVRQKLLDSGYHGNVQPSNDAERIYLLQSRTGVPKELLARQA